jgi:hypothetical protein
MFSVTDMNCSVYQITAFGLLQGWRTNGTRSKMAGDKITLARGTGVANNTWYIACMLCL